MTVGERIKELRTKLGMSQVDFADKINVSKQTLYKYENNIVTNIPSDKIEAAAKVGNISPSYLMGWKTEDDYWEEAIDYDMRARIDEFPDELSSHFFDYYDLSSDNQKLVDKYTKNLLSNQRMEEDLKKEKK